MRLFVGLDVPAAIVESVGQTIAGLRRHAPKLRWSPEENLHITTKFIGAWPEQRLGELTHALAGIRAGPFDVHLSGVGWFPNPHSPRIFWVPARGGEDLINLAAATDGITAALGIEKETKAFTPHLTLARVTPGVDLRELRGAVAGLANPDWGRFRAEAFHLYRSDAGPDASIYTNLASFPL